MSGAIHVPGLKGNLTFVRGIKFFKHVTLQQAHFWLLFSKLHEIMNFSPAQQVTLLSNTLL
jgi:hypothetical protein